MIVYFADRQLNIIGQASTGLPGGLMIVSDNKTEDIETGVSIFECKIPFDKETRSAVEEYTEVGNYVLRGNDGEKELYTIIDAEIDTKKQQVYIYAEDDGMDLLNEIVGEYAADKAYSIAHYINMYASKAGFTIGINEVKNLTRKLSWDGESTAAERIASIATQFGGCEISFTFEVDGLTVSAKHINIYKERGKDIGVTLRLNEDIDSIITTKSIANIATALQCTGDTPEDENVDDDIEPIPITLNGYKYDDGDFYVDGNLLKSRKAFQRWSRILWKTDDAQRSGGHIVKQYSYDTLSQQTLCNHAITELKKICDMEINYEVEISRLPDNVKIGDRVNIVDDAGELYVSARVLQLETSVTDQEYKAVLGEYLIKASGIHQKVIELAAQFAKTSVSAKRAYEIAKNAKATADNAQAQADAAITNAANAQTAADQAAAAADTATRSAAAAQTAADNAQAAVDVVESSVESLETTVTNAQAAADQAQQAAVTAQNKANEAAQAAQNAVNDAAEAKTNAANAQTKAEAATTNAATATSTANDAIAQAAAASQTAASAKADAEQAEKDVAAFGEDLTTLSETMEADYTRKSEFTETTASLQSQITKNAGEISSTVKEVTRIDETANNAAEQAATAQNTAAAAQTAADKAKADATAAQQAANNAAAAATNAQTEADNAKAAAATAKSVADQAEADLNAAKADLATVSGRVDATEEEIAAAQAAVTTAQSAADKAKADAATAQQKANAAQTTANTAVTNAANAQTAADDAADKADLAQQTANEAKGNAAAAQTKANEAAAAAATAQETANTAKTNAANAQTKANQAAADAAAAQKAADDADAKAAQAATDLATAKQNLANVTSRVDATEEEVAAAQAAVETAQAAADTAKANAATAQQTANTAKTNAANAQTAANNAKTAADNAQKAADAAKAAADKAQSDVNALAVRVTTAETDITQTKEQIALMATKTEVTQTLGGYYTKAQTDAAIKVRADSVTQSVSETINGIQVGGRNYILYGKGDTKAGFFTNFSTVENGYGEHTLTSQKTYSNISIAPGFVLGCRDYEIGKQVVFSFDIMFTEWNFPAGTTTNEWWIGQRYAGGTSESRDGAWRGVTNQFAPPKVGVGGCVLNEWFHASYVMTIPQQAHASIRTSSSIQFYNANADVAASMTFRIKNVKLEYGNRETDYSPAPEEMATDGELNAVSGRIETAESKLQQLANSIASFIRNGSSGSLVQQTADGISYFDISDLIADIAKNGGDISDLSAIANGLKSKVEYVECYKDSNGKPCIELGEGDTSFKVYITNEEIRFTEGSAVPAKINRQMLVIEKTMIKGELQFGDDADTTIKGVWIQKRRSNGNFGTSWKGVNS